MVFADRDNGQNFYHIKLSNRVLAEYVTEKAAERLVKGWNLLNEHEMAQENNQRERENKSCCSLVVIKEKQQPKTKPVTVYPVRIEPPNNNIKMFGFTLVRK